jgi:hypothetical protein
LDFGVFYRHPAGIFAAGFPIGVFPYIDQLNGADDNSGRLYFC